MMLCINAFITYGISLEAHLENMNPLNILLKAGNMVGSLYLHVYVHIMPGIIQSLIFRF